MIWLIALGCWTWETREIMDEVERQVGMEEHYDQATAARDAVIRADLPHARAQLSSLRGRLPMTSLPPRHEGREVALIEAVERGVEAQTLSDAARAVASIAAACGDCHSASRQGPELAPPPAREGEMGRHHWATSRLWDGLVASDPVALGQAFGALDLDLSPLEASADAAIPDLRAMIEAVARPDAKVGERVDAYAALLETCAACHAHTEGGPRP